MKESFMRPSETFQFCEGKLSVEAGVHPLYFGYEGKGGKIAQERWGHVILFELGSRGTGIGASAQGSMFNQGSP